MLVYANEIEVLGKNPALPILRGISGWLSEKLGTKFSVGDITIPGERVGGDPKAWLRVDRAVADTYRLYSWVLKHPDKEVSGRQWVTELGLKDDDGGASLFSCVIYTEEQSILVSEPVKATRPRVVKFIFENVQSGADWRFSPEMVGSSLKWVGEDIDSYRALVAEINSPSRSYPLVIVSPDNAGNYLVGLSRFQEVLFGLAQVIGVRKEYVSYDMEEILGRRYSAWSGAINVIRTPHRDGRVFSQLHLPGGLPDGLDSPKSVEAFLLGQVSHNTNVPRQRNRIRPEGVRTLSARLKLEKRLEALNSKPDNSLRDELGMVYSEIEDLTGQLEGLQRDNEVLELKLLESEEKVQEIEKDARRQAYSRNQALTQAKAESVDVPIDGVQELLGVATDTKGPTPEECLHLVEKLFPGRVIVLQSALQSAQVVESFAQGRRLLDMLARLVQSYLPAYLRGGDNAARSIFTNNEFAARESDTVVNNKECIAHRQFEFEGRRIEMLKHLKVGVADDPKLTIRVHFEIDQSKERVLVGHCGLHLPLPGR